MTGADDRHPTDAQLVAYLDGELSGEERAALARRIALDQETQARLAVLASGARPFKAAFEPLLDEAPVARLREALDRVQRDGSSRRMSASVHWPRLGLIAAGLALFLAGAAVATWLPLPFGPRSESESADNPGAWRQAVAEYLTLYTTETLASIPDDAAMRERELATVSDKLGVPLSSARVTLPDAAFKRAQLFEYEGKALGQIAYLDPATGPLALCVIANGEPDAARRTEQREGMNIIYWSRKGRGFMLIGRDAMPKLEALFAILSDRLGTS
ncbi:MAG: anti-sigma factor [Methylobacteriaceae bacterium]|nr:anti-sigma factor [Methylobacteriaceae bacterium]MBV9244108.1 anti-sigma factor [Methylobacteriaceae bacterium]